MQLTFSQFNQKANRNKLKNNSFLRPKHGSWKKAIKNARLIGKIKYSRLNKFPNLLKKITQK